MKLDLHIEILGLLSLICYLMCTFGNTHIQWDPKVCYSLMIEINSQNQQHCINLLKTEWSDRDNSESHCNVIRTSTSDKDIAHENTIMLSFFQPVKSDEIENVCVYFFVFGPIRFLHIMPPENVTSLGQVSCLMGQEFKLQQAPRRSHKNSSLSNIRLRRKKTESKRMKDNTKKNNLIFFQKRFLHFCLLQSNRQTDG